MQTMLGVESDLKLCRQLLQQCKESFSGLVSYYGENAQAFANDAVFWSDVTTFVDRFTACQKLLRKQMQVTCRLLSRMSLHGSITAAIRLHSTGVAAFQRVVRSCCCTFALGAFGFEC